MKRISASFAIVLLALFGISCGSGRHLESISITQTPNGSQPQFIATGTFSSAPFTVTPLPVQWTIGLMAPPPPTYTYTLTTQPFVFNCSVTSGPYLPVGAYAPVDASAPSSGSTKNVVVAYQSVNCQ